MGPVSRLLRRLPQEYDHLRLARRRDDVPYGFSRLGTRYGGSCVPAGLLAPGSLAICVGAGEDISFDLRLVQQCRMRVHILDPTPRAEAHVLEVLEGVRGGRAVPINHDPTQRYDLTGVDPRSIIYHKQGLWIEDAIMRFFAPKDARHVSHSLTNPQKTEAYFEAECVTFASFCARESLTDVELLKLDVEGAEYAVLSNILAGKVLPKVLCVEFHGGIHRLQGYFQRITSSIEALRAAGYLLGCVDRWNLTFLHRDKAGLVC